MAGSLLSNLFTRGAEKVDRAVGWSNLPTPLAVPVLIGLRERLRESNLFDTGRELREIVEELELPPAVVRDLWHEWLTDLDGCANASQTDLCRFETRAACANL